MKKIITLLVAAPFVLGLAACATTSESHKTPEPVITQHQPNTYTAYTESWYGVPDAQAHDLKAARHVCGKQGLDVFPSNEKSEVVSKFGGMGYKLVFTCGHMSK